MCLPCDGLPICSECFLPSQMSAGIDSSTPQRPKRIGGLDDEWIHEHTYVDTCSSNVSSEIKGINREFVQLYCESLYSSRKTLRLEHCCEDLITFSHKSISEAEVSEVR